jgi:F-type H+-transporting ATPase subunit b
MAEPTAHTEAPGGHGAFPPFQAQHFPSQLLWLVVSFVLLYALMSRIALPRIASIFADRSKRIADDLAAADRSIAATRTAAMSNVGSIAAETATAIVERLIGTSPSQQDVAAALRDVSKP